MTMTPSGARAAKLTIARVLATPALALFVLLGVIWTTSPAAAAPITADFAVAGGSLANADLLIPAKGFKKHRGFRHRGFHRRGFHGRGFKRFGGFHGRGFRKFGGFRGGFGFKKFGGYRGGVGFKKFRGGGFKTFGGGKSFVGGDGFRKFSDGTYMKLDADGNVLIKEFAADGSVVIKKLNPDGSAVILK